MYPSAESDRVRVVHAPSAPVCKGTTYILAALNRLRGYFDFELVLVEDAQRASSQGDFHSVTGYLAIPHGRFLDFMRGIR